MISHDDRVAPLNKSGIAADRILLGFGLAMLFLAILFGGDSRLTDIIGSTSIVLGAVLLPKLRARSNGLPVRLLYILYIIPALYISYPIAITLGRHLHTQDFDQTLISIDRFFFAGADPTRWLFAHLKLAPFAVEVLQVCYYAHYLYPLILGASLYRGDDESQLLSYRMLMVYGSLLSFIGNMVIPAIGPRFTLHEFADLSKELPGMFLTEPIRAMINAAEGVSASMTSSVASLTVFRDAFPSGHTMLTLLTLWSAFHCRSRVRWFLLPLGSVLIISTILLRYHYVTDVLAGIIFAALTIWSAPKVAKLIGRERFL